MITARDFEKTGMIASINFPHTVTSNNASKIIIDYLNKIEDSNASGNDLKINQEFMGKFIPTAHAVNAEDRKKLDTALAYLQQNPEAAKLIEQAAKNGVTIVMVNMGHSCYHPLNYGSKDGIIFWNPNESVEYFENINGKQVSLGERSPANGLFHELVHATDPKYVGPVSDVQNYLDRYDINNVNSKYYNAPEQKAVITTNELVGKFHGEPIRPDYIGKVKYGNAQSTIDFHTIEYNKRGEIEREITQTYDDKKGIVSRQTVDFYPDEPNKQCTVKETLTDIYGKPISQSQSKDSASISPQEIDWNKISNKDLYAAILSGDTQSRTALAASFAQSDAGMALKARGAELYAEQQAEQRQQAFQREWEQMQEQAEQRRQQEAEQQQSQSLSRGIRR